MTNSNHDATKNSLDDGISETNVCQLKMNLNDNRWHSPLLIPLEVLFELLTLKLLHFLLFRSYCKKYKKHRSGSWTPTVEIPWKHLLPTYSTLYYVTDTLYPGRYSGVAGSAIITKNYASHVESAITCVSSVHWKMWNEKKVLIVICSICHAILSRFCGFLSNIPNSHCLENIFCWH